MRLNHETKGSNGGQYGMQTPLTNFHAFNGRTQAGAAPSLRKPWLTVTYAF
ncbi:MAG: hypothetical protein M3R58_17480 [Pseudomonadota bacterium]|nr:hypothetical protein [Pseudomonadota bacterium]